ncbi:MAG: hypothetical protein ACJAY5_000017 [Actinomycetes bacterium]|jgi:hypothetical protein
MTRALDVRRTNLQPNNVLMIGIQLSRILDYQDPFTGRN